MAMSRKLKGKWVKALCSGKYKQGKAALLSNDRWCCLGVLGSVSGIPEYDLQGGGWLKSGMNWAMRKSSAG